MKIEITYNMLKKSGIYCITARNNTQKIYIGSAKNLEARKKRHFQALAKGKHFNQKLQNYWNQYGPDIFHFNVILWCPPHSLLFWEQQFINYFNPYFNINPIAGSRLDSIHSINSRLKTSATMKKKPRPQPEKVLYRITQ